MEPDEQASEKIERKFYFQVDALKALAIFFVIMDHTLPWGVKWSMLAPFWERTSIPLFLIIMGFNLGHSFQWSGETNLRELYSQSYIKKKILRFILPLFILIVTSTLVGLYLGVLEFNWSILLGILPFRGPGNWFVPVIVTSIFVFPLVYWAFIRRPRLTVGLCLASDLALHAFFTLIMPILWPGLPDFSFITVFIRMNILTHLFAVGIGLWFSKGHGLDDYRNAIVWVLGPLSAMYLGAWLIVGFRFPFVVGDYSAFAYPYSALLFLIALDSLPEKASGRFADLVKTLSRSTYHIFLFQIFYFSIVYFYWPSFTQDGFGTEIWFYFIYFGINVIVTFTGGVSWFKMEQWIRSEIKQKLGSGPEMLFS
jgi:hypothetical protein